MLFLLCFLLCSGFAYGMEKNGYFTGPKSKDNSDWLKERRKQNKKSEEEYKKRLAEEEKLKIKNEKEKAKQEALQQKLREKERAEREKLQRKLNKKVANLPHNSATKPQASTISFASFLIKKKRAELPKFDEEKTNTL